MAHFWPIFLIFGAKESGSLEKRNNTIPRKRPDKRKAYVMTDRPYFIGPFRLPVTAGNKTKNKKKTVFCGIEGAERFR